MKQATDQEIIEYLWPHKRRVRAHGGSQLPRQNSLHPTLKRFHCIDLTCSHEANEAYSSLTISAVKPRLPSAKAAQMERAGVRLPTT
jgi:hypothetical protein